MNFGGLMTALLSGGGITYLLGWMAGRKKNKADLEGVKLTNLESIIRIYEKGQNELKDQLEVLSTRCKHLSEEIEGLRIENISLKKEIKLLNDRLKKSSN